MSPPATAAADLLILEFIAGNRRTPHAVFASLLASLSSPSASPRTSQRLRQALVLRALDAALRTEGAVCSSSLLLHKARKVLADPDAAACFPHQISFADNEGNDEARAAAAVADLKRLLDLEWANLPPSTLERTAGRIAGETWAAADHTKLGESTEREILAKLVQDGSAASHQPILTEVADYMKNAREADGARRDNEADPSHENNGAARGQEGTVGHQNASVNGGEGQRSEKSVPAFKKCNLMERKPNASTNEWDSPDDDQPVRKRKLHPSPTCAPHKIRKKWSEIEEKTLLEGVEKYGKGNWKDIKLAYPDVFAERSTVDLKDKLRNLERHHQEGKSA